MAGVDVATAPRKTLTAHIFRQMSREVILGRLKELEKLSNRLFNPFEVETLHEMRIAAKRLRYAIELFQSCWGHSIATYAKRAARVQTALGDLHDCDVWIENIGKQINNARKNKDAAQVAALVWLLNHFIKLRSKHLRQAFAEWSRWEAQDLIVNASTAAILRLGNTKYEHRLYVSLHGKRPRSDARFAGRSRKRARSSDRCDSEAGLQGPWRATHLREAHRERLRDVGLFA
jgi:hypothetical protein